MCVTPVKPSFTARSIVIDSKYGKNASRKLLFNEVMDIANRYNASVIYETGAGKINFPNIPEKLEKALLNADIRCHLKAGDKLKLII